MVKPSQRRNRTQDVTTANEDTPGILKDRNHAAQREPGTTSAVDRAARGLLGNVFSKCHWAAYSARLIADLIKNAGHDVKFTWQNDPKQNCYRSDLIGPAKFRLQLSQAVATEVQPTSIGMVSAWPKVMQKTNIQ